MVMKRGSGKWDKAVQKTNMPCLYLDSATHKQ